MKALLALAAVAPALLGPALAAEPLEERGRAAFMRNGCHGCHTVGRLGSPIGPDLSHVGRKYAPDYLERWLRDPAATSGTAHMPALELSEADVTTLTGYLASLR
jgi:cytochrome c oxidase subunit 2